MTDLNRIYYNARQTCLSMMQDRGYTLPSTLLVPLTDREFDVAFDKKQMDLAGVTDHLHQLPVYVRIIEPSRQFNILEDRDAVFKEAAKYFNSIGLAGVTDHLTLIKALDKGKARLIIIYNSRRGRPQIAYEKAYMDHPFIEVYQVHKLAINPLNTKYQSKWELITDSQTIADIYHKNDANPIMFGSVCLDDPINRYYGGRPAENGQPANLYKVTRGGVNIFYRKVITKKMNLK